MAVSPHETGFYSFSRFKCVVAVASKPVHNNHRLNMGGFSSVFVRIPDGQDPWGAATNIARLLHDSSPGNRNSLWVQYTDGFSWLHVEGWENFQTLPPALSTAGHEVIYLICHEGSGSCGYLHFLDGICLREISVSDRILYSNSGVEEVWEPSARDHEAKKFAAEGDGFEWPHCLRAEIILRAFSLPSPWSGGDLEILDICISVANPEENDMSHSLAE
ncbi:MAG: hypothetical protein J0L73_06335 [Verrucomicrobia bacterium]|nr:hypothetical protein [Verrucomicrobiota bacterium]